MHNVIYKITHKESGTSYIGMAKNFRKRMNSHKCLSNKDKPKQHIHRAIKKYGWDSFEKEIIRKDISDTSLLEAAEIFYIGFYNTFYDGYNMSKGGDNNYGYVYGEYHSSRVKEGLSRVEENGKTVAQNASIKAMKSRRSYKGEGNPFYGKTHSEETKKKLRKPKSNTENMKWTEDRKKKCSEALKGRTFSEETKQKLKEASKKHWESLPVLTCPHCNKEGKGPNMTRYHFDNCKKLSKNIV